MWQEGSLFAEAAEPSTATCRLADHILQIRAPGHSPGRLAHEGYKQCTAPKDKALKSIEWQGMSLQTSAMSMSAVR